MGNRERRRAEVTEAILSTARAHLAKHGAAGLSLRAIARDVGMVSSAVYRYVASRDDLLTALIVEAYDELGAAAEQAAAVGGSPRDRWRAVWRATRAWGVAHPEQWALVYGSPVPGYVAPETTIPAAGRLGLALAGIVGEHPRPAPVPDEQTVAAIAEAIPGLPRVAGPAAVAAWTDLVGTVSFELFGHYQNVVLDRETYLDHVADRAATAVGLPVS